MTERGSSTTSDVVSDHACGRLLSFWVHLDRGWKAVVLGLVVLAAVVAGVEIPW